MHACPLLWAKTLLTQLWSTAHIFSLLLQARCLVKAKFIILDLTMDQMTRCNLKGTICRDEPPENYLPTHLLDSLLWSILESLSTFFFFFFLKPPSFTLFLPQSHCSDHCCFQSQQAPVLSKKAINKSTLDWAISS